LNLLSDVHSPNKFPFDSLDQDYKVPLKR